MSKEKNQDNGKYKILAFGIEKTGLSNPTDIDKRKYSIHFEVYGSTVRFQDYDGVILFKGIFEELGRTRNMYHSRSYCNSDKDQLDKKLKEVELLLKNGGFMCYLMANEFTDETDQGKVTTTDLVKCRLHYSDLYRNNFSERTTKVECKLGEFKNFFDLYGGASSYFNFPKKIATVLAEAFSETVSMILFRQEYFISTLIPDNDKDALKDYFTTLADAITSTQSKIIVQPPEWVNDFQFEEEKQIISKIQLLQEQIDGFNSRLEKLKYFKGLLVYGNDDLVDCVDETFKEGFNIPVDSFDELKEDLKLLNEKDEPICLCEVKGVNGGITRKHINQTDTHRERSGFTPEFPTILIANTKIKNSKSIADKDQTVAPEQIKHAVKMGVLILRTIDLLGMLRLFLLGDLERDRFIEILTTECGLLKCIDEEPYEIIKE